MTLNIVEMSNTVKQFFTESAKQTAKTTEFVKRESKMTGSLWLQMWVLGLLETPQSALSHLAEWCEDQQGVLITPQALHDRLHPAAVAFMKTMFALALTLFRQTICIPLLRLRQFSVSVPTW